MMWLHDLWEKWFESPIPQTETIQNGGCGSFTVSYYPGGGGGGSAPFAVSGVAGSGSPPSHTTDLSYLTDTEVVALTLLGEAESLGMQGMKEVACVLQNRLKLDPKLWGYSLRDVCLKPEQFDCWLPGADRDRIIANFAKGFNYAPYVLACGIATDLVRFGITDVTNGACGYYDEEEIKPPDWSVGKTPCYVSKPNLYFDRAAMLA